MNILFIWIGKISPLYEWRTRCIRRAMELYPTARFTVITCLATFFGFEIIAPLDNGISIENTMRYSDFARMEYLSKYPNTLYLDTDTWCIKPMDIMPGMGNAGFEAIWNGLETEHIREVFAKRGDKTLLYELQKHFHGKDLSEYFEHKPAWSNQYRRPDLEEFDPTLEGEPT